MSREYRKKVQDTIEEKERLGLFNEPVEDDPPSGELLPGKADYLNKKLSSKINRKIANALATKFFEKMIKNGDIVLGGVEGLDNFTEVKDRGVIVTCNHFSIADSYLIYKVLHKKMPRKWKLFKVIREGNYTGFKGFFGYVFRHCNTLPLSRNTATMLEFMRAVSVLLDKGEKILIYPEQEMWRDYRKPRPFKVGAFRIAAKNGVPVLPIFATMKDTDKLDADGYPVQAYTFHILPAIYPREDLGFKENCDYLKEENYKAVTELYERVYGKPLKYGE